MNAKAYAQCPTGFPFSDDSPADAPQAAPSPRPLRRLEMFEKSWDRLLRFLAGGQADQGAAYERVRQRLVDFFTAKGELNAEELTDATFDRLLQKLTDQDLIEVRAPIGYTLRFARFILLERIKSEATRRQRLETMYREPDSTESTHEDQRSEQRLNVLQRCLSEMSAADRQLLLTYYSYDGRERIASRQEISRELGINVGLLRTRMARLRSNLHDRVRALTVVGEQS